MVHPYDTFLPTAKPFVVYVPNFDELMIIPNDYGIDYETAMKIIRCGLLDHIVIEFVGEL